MGGIVGVYGECDQGVLSEMLSRIRHRGPDEEGTYRRPETPLEMLDHSLVEILYNDPAAHKLRGGSYKPLLGTAVRDIVHDRSKHGFNVPIGRWFRNDHEAIDRWLTEANVEATPYLDVASVFDLWTEHRRGRTTSTRCGGYSTTSRGITNTSRVRERPRYRSSTD